MDIFISGMGAVSILGKGIEEHRRRLFYSEAAAAPYRPTAENLKRHSFEMLPIEEEKKNHSKRLGYPLSRNSTLALMALQECLESSALRREDMEGRRIAIIMGTTAGCSSTDSEYSKQFTMDRTQPSPYNNAIRQNPAGILKESLNIKADVFLINNACTSSTDALGLGAKLLEQNKYDLVFAGGADEIVFQSFCGFNSLQLLSPKFRCSPFDKNRDGLLLTEAAAVLSLERANDFKRRARASRKALGSIIGYESVTESFHQTGPHPEAEGLQYVSSELFRKSSLQPSDITFINAHGTGTPSNDSSEGKFFARFMPQVPVVATKGYTGHCLGAVGALEAIFCLLSFEERKLPASYGFQEEDPSIGFAPTKEITPFESQTSPIAYSTSVGFGGVNSGLLLRAPERNPA